MPDRTLRAAGSGRRMSKVSRSRSLERVNGFVHYDWSVLRLGVEVRGCRTWFELQGSEPLGKNPSTTAKTSGL